MNMAIYRYFANGGNLYPVCCDDFCFTVNLNAGYQKFPKWFSISNYYCATNGKVVWPSNRLYLFQNGCSFSYFEV